MIHSQFVRVILAQDLCRKHEQVTNSLQTIIRAVLIFSVSFQFLWIKKDPLIHLPRSIYAMPSLVFTHYGMGRPKSENFPQKKSKTQINHDHTACFKNPNLIVDA
eukprot:TRINITY_DN11898_c0_g1_i1.p1 TRINITY_DN11898_c0_g1~~TRINITY_DN11898_c0_g1_i1.p1  ORF type:complete len:105 (+),score=2.83 TRINITY_DN11898_c0_g1_i1:139-453(+)